MGTIKVIKEKAPLVEGMGKMEGISDLLKMLMGDSEMEKPIKKRSMALKIMKVEPKQEMGEMGEEKEGEECD
jgi:hypothetical protein